MNSKFIFSVLLCALFFTSCKEDTLPKPRAMLRLEYPKTEYGKLSTENFEFQRNHLAKVKIQDQNALSLNYPGMKGAIFINYKRVNGNLNKLLSDAQRLSYEHAAKADGIKQQEFLNTKDKVYGMFYAVSGDAASQAQFYATDSTEHFVMGSLYFYARPNYDSIYPAASYLQEDMGRILETLKWRN
ncbi:MAG: gliding motility lipoprotein GldD [Flavobacteriaceae bacterium]